MIDSCDGSNRQVEALYEELQNHRVELKEQQAELERTSLALERSRRDFDELRDNAPVADLLHDNGGYLYEINRRARLLLGLQPCQKSINIYDVLTKKAAELYRFHISRLKNSVRPVSIEMRLERSSGKALYILAESSICGDNQIQTIMVDVSSRKESEEVKRELDSHLLHSQKMEILDRISGGIAHDFNNILQVLVLQVDLAGEQVVNGDHSAVETIQQVSETANRGVALTKRLLAFSRKKPLEKVRGDLNEIIEGSENLLSQSVGQNWKIAFDLAPHRLGVWVDPVQIEQALLNLCLNAKDAMPHGGVIEISTAHKYIEAPTSKSGLPLIPGNYSVISIRDEGTGIPANIVSRVFEPYFSTKEVGKGTGLGMSIVYSIMKQHAGAIEIFESDENGTQIDLYLFGFHLPEKPDIVKGSIDSVSKHMVGSALICEDEPAILSVLCDALRKMGMNVYSAADGDSAIRQIAAIEKIDLLLTDVVIPGKCGRKISRSFREKFPEANVVLMSGHGDSVLDESFLHEVNATFLPKPFKLDNLKEKLGIHLISR